MNTTNKFGALNEQSEGNEEGEKLSQKSNKADGNGKVNEVEQKGTKDTYLAYGGTPSQLQNMSKESRTPGSSASNNKGMQNIEECSIDINVISKEVRESTENKSDLANNEEINHGPMENSQKVSHGRSDEEGKEQDVRAPVGIGEDTGQHGILQAPDI